jgi:hypothetical protein
MQPVGEQQRAVPVERAGGDADARGRERRERELPADLAVLDIQ